MIKLNNGMEIPQIGVGTWTLRDDVVGHEVIQKLAAKYGKTASQIVLRWIVQRDLITIPRAKPNHLAENLEILQFSLEAEDMEALNALNINLRSNKDNDPETFPW